MNANYIKQVSHAAKDEALENDKKFYLNRVSFLEKELMRVTKESSQQKNEQVPKLKQQLEELRKENI